MAGDNSRRIVPITPQQLSEDTYKLCHRAMSAHAVMAQVAPAGVLGGQPQVQPVAIACQSPCVGPRCRMWNAEEVECNEVIAATHHVARLGCIEEGLSALNLRLGDITDLLTPPKDGRAPRQVEIVNIESPTLTAFVELLKARLVPKGA